MKIGLNATCMTSRSSGATQRFRGLYRELFKELHASEFIIYEPKDIAISNWFNSHENVRFVQTGLLSDNRLQKLIFGYSFWPMETRNRQLDLFESFNLPITESKSGNNLLTIHDIRDLKEGVNSLYREVYRCILTDSIRRAAKIITVSEVMRDEILDHYPDASVSVVYNGVDVSLFQNIKDEDIISVRRRLRLPDEYILTVGHFEKRKNYSKLIDALSLLLRMKNNTNLVIVGNDSGELENIKNHAKDHGVAENLFIFSGVSDLDTRAIYRGAKLFVFPSKYEGFGIPIIEAMAAEIPVVLSDIPIFREICQGSGLYFNCNDSDEIANAIKHVLSSETEAKRLVQYGRQRVVDFSFSSAAHALKSVYEDVL